MAVQDVDAFPAGIDVTFRLDEPHDKADSPSADGNNLPETLLANADDDLCEVFAIEADELLSNVEANLRALYHSPSNENAMWEIRRSLHTYKGAAGMVGAPGHSAVAHKIEDLLGRLAGEGKVPDEPVLDAIASASAYLRSAPSSQGQEFRDQCRRLDSAISKISSDEGGAGAASETKIKIAGPAGQPAPARPVVRVSVDRLNGIAASARELAAGFNALENNFAELIRCLDRLARAGLPNEILEPLRGLGETVAADMAGQRRLVAETFESAARIRLIAFGSLFTRLERGLIAACEEEGRSARFVMHGQDVQLDTDLVNYLVEPVAHLVRNAVAHGIESPETRRMLGKPSTGLIEVSVRDMGPHVELTVRDDGRGIDGAGLRESARKAGIATELQTGLEELSVLDLMCLRGLTTARRLTTNAGRGIGLSIVREGVEARGGKLCVDSTPLLGSAFSIKLPQVNRDIPTPKPAVLVVDDSAAFRFSAAQILAGLGFSVEFACDGVEALELLRSSSVPDVVLADVEMPRMNGFVLAAEIRRAFPGRTVMLMSSRDDQAVRENAGKLGVDFLSKPLTAEDLSLALARFLPIRD